MLSAFQPQLVGSQVLSFTDSGASLQGKGHKAGRFTVVLPTSLDHERFCSLRSCMGPLANAHTPWLSARIDDISSQKLYVVFHTADQEASLAYAAMPSPSAKLKAARRLPKHLRLSGAPPSGALAEARAEAAARYARGESNQHGQHSCLQGKSHTEGVEAGQHAWYDQSWHDDWGSQWGQDGWHASTATGSTDVWQARPDLPTRPAQRWQPKIEARRDGSSELASAGLSEINTGTRAQMDAKLGHEPNQWDSNRTDLEVEMGPPASKKRPQMSTTTGEVRSQGAGKATAPTQAEGTRLSAPSDSFEELVVGKPDMETGAAQDDRNQAAGRHSEELKQAAMSRQKDDQEAQRAVDARVFPAPLPGARGGPEGWNQLPIEHVNKRLLRWWNQHPRASVDTPSPANFLRAFFATRPGAEGVSLFDPLRGPEGSCFAGFDRFATTTAAAHCDAHEELLVGFHGTHLHTLWSIMRAGMAESGPGTPGSRFFQLPKPGGTTADVSGVYCFQQSLRHKCLYYAVAVLFQLVIELSFFRSSINKRGKHTDQCIVQQATVQAIHVQVAPAQQLELGTQTMTWHPSLEAHPEQYVRLVQQTQVASSSGRGGGNHTPSLSGQRSSAPPGGIEMLTLSDFDPARGGDQAGIDQAGTRLSAPAGHTESAPGLPAPTGVSQASREKTVHRDRCSHQGAELASRLPWAEGAEWPLLAIQLEPLPVCSYELQPLSGGLGTHDQAPWLLASYASMQGNEPPFAS